MLSHEPSPIDFLPRALNRCQTKPHTPRQTASFRCSRSRRAYRAPCGTAAQRSFENRRNFSVPALTADDNRGYLAPGQSIWTGPGPTRFPAKRSAWLSRLWATDRSTVTEERDRPNHRCADPGELVLVANTPKCRESHDLTLRECGMKDSRATQKRSASSNDIIDDHDAIG